MTSTDRGFPLHGFLLAIGSAASFALSGTFASALMSAGWSPGAAATVRISLAALALAVPTVVALRGQWSRVRRAGAPILLFGLLAVAGCQLAFFLAVEFIPPSLALLIEFMGPVLLMLWTWARSRVAPSALTLLGASIAAVGLVAVSGVVTGEALDPIGVLFALGAAVGNAAYYAAGASSDHGIPPLPFVGLGLAVGAATLLVTSAFGTPRFAMTDAPAVIAGAPLSPVIVVAGLVLVSTVLAYVLGVAASRRLGAIVSSFTGYSEALFGILWTIVLLAIVPSGWEWLGAALIVTGVVTVKVGELAGERRGAAAASRAPIAEADILPDVELGDGARLPTE